MKSGTAARALNYVSHTASVTYSFLITVRPEVQEVSSRLGKNGSVAKCPSPYYTMCVTALFGMPEVGNET